MKIQSKNTDQKTSEYLLARIMAFLPLRFISSCSGFLANLRAGGLLTPVILWFARTYKVNLEESSRAPNEYISFNDFFDRKLKPEARKIDKSEKSIASPVDGTVLSFGSLDENIIIEAKGTGSSLDDLLSMPGFRKRFTNGDYIVIYLSPRDYHRIHSPLKGKIIGYHYIPGRLYPVNSFAVNNIDRLFSVNERLISFIENPRNKLCALVKVGATNVGSIRLTYREDVTTNRFIRRKEADIFAKPFDIDKGEEIAYFELGSTVILLFENSMVKLRKLASGQKVKVGEPLADLT